MKNVFINMDKQLSIKKKKASLVCSKNSNASSLVLYKIEQHQQ